MLSSFQSMSKFCQVYEHRSGMLFYQMHLGFGKRIKRQRQCKCDQDLVGAGDNISHRSQSASVLDGCRSMFT